MDVKRILEKLKNDEITVNEALTRLKSEPFEDLGYAKVDFHRRIIQGAGEVIYGSGKTVDQINGIITAMKNGGQDRILATRIDGDAAEGILKVHPDAVYHAEARAVTLGKMPEASGAGYIMVATGGTSDIPVAEEAALTAEFLGNEVRRVYDVGVAGLHRLLDHAEDIMNASVIIAVAGMEGALASVIGGLSDSPVIAVPTSVGYGASFEGLSALLSMLNSCASGVTVVNIDNGFGAGYSASMMNHMEAGK